VLWWPIGVKFQSVFRNQGCLSRARSFTHFRRTIERSLRIKPTSHLTISAQSLPLVTTLASPVARRLGAKSGARTHVLMSQAQGAAAWAWAKEGMVLTGDAWIVGSAWSAAAQPAMHGRMYMCEQG